MTRSRPFWRVVLLAVVIGGAVGCRILPERPPPAKRYDFGGEPLTAKGFAGLPIHLVLDHVVAPLWLDTQQIQYRSLYEEPERLHAYAQSQWVASPATLLRYRFSQILFRVRSATPTPQKEPTYQIHIELDSFEQVFGQPDQAHAVIRLRAVLVDPRRQLPVARRYFTVRRSSPPNAKGAVEALKALTDRVILQVLQWTKQASPAEQG